MTADKLSKVIAQLDIASDHLSWECAVSQMAIDKARKILRDELSSHSPPKVREDSPGMKAMTNELGWI